MKGRVRSCLGGEGVVLIILKALPLLLLIWYCLECDECVFLVSMFLCGFSFPIYCSLILVG